MKHNGRYTVKRPFACFTAALLLILSVPSCAQTTDPQKFIRDMYENALYENYDFLENHCSPLLLERLHAEYDYDGGGYAVWEFRSGYQDGPDKRNYLTAVSPIGDNWYKYEGFDMGNYFQRFIKLVRKDGKMKIEDLRSFNTVSVEKFEQVISDSGVIRLDVRTPEEFSQGHLPYSINIDIQSADFKRKASELDRNSVIAAYCRSGRRSQTAVNELVKLGFSGYELDGGILAWQKDGKETVR